MHFGRTLITSSSRHKGTMSRYREHALAVLATLAVVALSSCSKERQNAEPQAFGEPIIVSAAASTKEVIEALAQQFREQSRMEVKINTGPSNGLAAQILAAAPADLFLSASQQWADEIQKGGQAEAMVRLLTSRLVLVVPKGNPAQVHEPKDLLSANVQKVALAGEKVPAGIYAAQALEKLGLVKQLEGDGKIVRGQDVRSALSYVDRGEAEAGIVYSTDVAAAPSSEIVYHFDPKLHDEIVYVLVLLKQGSNTPSGRKFYEFLQSQGADAAYSKFGFERLH
jgi:molybdate transport system substrate-binding protein